MNEAYDTMCPNCMERNCPGYIQAGKLYACVNERVKLSARYRQRLQNYLEWNLCSTPMDGVSTPYSMNVVFDDAGPTAAEAVFNYETHGMASERCREPELLSRYLRGKGNRDWWTKEIGWWRKHALFLAEEFLSFLTPEAFFDLFGHFPRTWFVRDCFDNNYTEEMLAEDQRVGKFGLEREQGGFVIRHEFAG